jgi:post-segregation antitoxin (ccd killing protein)
VSVKDLGYKKITTIRIDEDLLKKAHNLGLNVSKISENAIKEAIERMERKA